MYSNKKKFVFPRKCNKNLLSVLTISNDCFYSFFNSRYSTLSSVFTRLWNVWEFLSQIYLFVLNVDTRFLICCFCAMTFEDEGRNRREFLVSKNAAVNERFFGNFPTFFWFSFLVFFLYPKILRISSLTIIDTTQDNDQNISKNISSRKKDIWCSIKVNHLVAYPAMWC